MKGNNWRGIYGGCETAGGEYMVECQTAGGEYME
jgi:hypothetical protein